MTNPLLDPAPEALFRTSEENFAGMTAYVGRLLKGTVREGPDLHLVSTEMPSAIFNRVFAASFSQEDAPRRVRETVRLYRRRNVPWVWVVGPMSQTPDLGSYLEAGGLVQKSAWPCMAIDMSDIEEAPPEPQGVQIERVADTDTLQQWGAVFNRVYKTPSFVGDALCYVYAKPGFKEELPLRYYIATLRGKPVAISSCFMDAGVAGIYSVGTLAEARGKGIGTAVTLAAMLDACLLGYRVATLQSSDEGYNIYSRIGFKEYGRVAIYGLPE